MLPSALPFTRRNLYALLAAMLLLGMAAQAQNNAFDGYTLFSALNGRTTYLVDMAGKTVHTWSHTYSGGYATYLLPNGHLLRAAMAPNAQLRGGAYHGLLQEFDWNGSVVWEYTYSGPNYIAHHDIEPMPNGNVLMIAWEVKSASEAAAMGRSNASTLWPDHIIEVRPEPPSGGSIVWEWHIWDHLVQNKDANKPNYGVISEHPERFDVNLIGGSSGPWGGDWQHVNAVSYNPDRDEIVFSSHFMNEFYIIDHSTTTAEAAGSTGGQRGKGGDFLYRWGKPSNYGVSGSTVFDVVHCAWWIPRGLAGEGNVLVYNNGARKLASEILELSLPFDAQGNYAREAGAAFGPEQALWKYSNGRTFFSNHLGGNQRLPNGNTFITEATSGFLFEVTSDGQVVWQYNFGREIARALRYARDYPGVAALNPTATDALPTNPTLRVWNAPNPFQTSTVLTIESGSAGALSLCIHDALGRIVHQATREMAASGTIQEVWNGRDLLGNPVSSGVYYYRVRMAGVERIGSMLHAH